MPASPMFDAWLAHVRERLAAATRADPWRGQPPHELPWLLLVDRRFLIATVLALLGFAATGWVAVVGEAAPRWLPWWLPLIVAVPSTFDAWNRALLWRTDCRDAARRVRDAELAVAAVVMANDGLYDRKRRDDLPGVLVATLDPELSRDPHRLRALARELHRWKGCHESDVPPPLRPIAALLTSEAGRFDPLPVPRAACGNDATWLSSCWVVRDQLPHGVLDREIVPVLAQRGPDPAPVRSLPMAQWSTREFDAALADEFGCSISEEPA